MRTLLLPIALFSISFQVFALVDYSDPQPEPTRMQKNFSKVQPKVESSGSGRSDFSFSSSYEMSEIKSEKVGAVNFDLHYQSPYNVFLDANFWQADYKGKSQAGNPKVMLGFNWLRIGSASDEARLDLLAGMRLPGQSELATSRTDKIFGVETTKRFMNFGLGLGYDLTLTGDAKKQDEMSIGNIHRFSVSAGWMVSNDIQFELEAENFKVNQSADANRSNRLLSPASFSTLSPKMNLGLASFVNFVLGARFQMQKSPIDAKVFDLHGANSNSIFTGLNFNI